MIPKTLLLGHRHLLRRLPDDRVAAGDREGQNQNGTHGREIEGER